MAKILSVFVGIIVSLMTVFGSVKVNPPKDESDFVPVLRFTVASDSHVRSIGDGQCKKLRKTIKLGNTIAERDEKYNSYDAAIFAGDLTNSGTAAQYTGFFSSIKSELKKETQLIPIVAKSHDGNKMGKKSLTFFKELTGLDTDTHYVINGFHFIGISAGNIKGEHYSEYQRTWLREQLDAAVADDPMKPIFVAHHEHILNTVYGSSDFDGWGMDYFTDILYDYPQIVDFSGHSHYPLNDPRSINQLEITTVGTGSLTYAEFTVDNERKVHPSGNDKNGQCWVVEVDAENRVRLRGYDLTSDSVLCEYILTNLTDINERQYSRSGHMAHSFPPYFANGTRVTYKNGKVNFPAAESSDSKIIFLYRIKCLDADGNELSSKWELNDYWHVPSRTSFSVPVTLSSGTKTVSVTAENAFGMRSDTIYCSVK